MRDEKGSLTITLIFLIVLCAVGLAMRLYLGSYFASVGLSDFSLNIFLWLDAGCCGDGVSLAITIASKHSGVSSGLALASFITLGNALAEFYFASLWKINPSTFVTAMWPIWDDVKGSVLEKFDCCGLFESGVCDSKNGCFPSMVIKLSDRLRKFGLMFFCLMLGHTIVCLTLAKTAFKEFPPYGSEYAALLAQRIVPTF